MTIGNLHSFIEQIFIGHLFVCTTTGLDNPVVNKKKNAHFHETYNQLG